MGFGRFLLLGDLGQQLDLAEQERQIERLRAEVARGAGSGSNLEPTVRRLQTENDELRMYLAAIIRLLTNKGLITRAEIEEIVTTLDAEDGHSDGKFGGALKKS
jgi:hypothetical protein